MTSNRGVCLLTLILSVALWFPSPARSDDEPWPYDVDSTFDASEQAPPGSGERVPRTERAPSAAQIEELRRLLEGRCVRVTTADGTFEMRRAHVNAQGIRPGDEVDYGPVTFGGRPSRFGDVLEEDEGDPTELFPWASIRRIDEGHVRRHKGAIIGGALGALASYALFPLIGWYTQTIPLGLVVGCIAPVAVGAGVGAAIPSRETWTPVYLNDGPGD